MGEIGEIWREINEEKKARRQKRMQKFSDDTVLELFKSQEVLAVDNSNGTYCIVETKRFGKIHIYPKANRLLICKQNKWISGAMNWINKNLI